MFEFDPHSNGASWEETLSLWNLVFFCMSSPPLPFFFNSHWKINANKYFYILQGILNDNDVQYYRESAVFSLLVWFMVSLICNLSLVSYNWSKNIFFVDYAELLTLIICLPVLQQFVCISEAPSWSIQRTFRLITRKILVKTDKSRSYK